MSEIARVKSGRTVTTELTNRLFRLKLQLFLDDLLEKQIFGRVIAIMMVIEYRKVICC